MKAMGAVVGLLLGLAGGFAVIGQERKTESMPSTPAASTHVMVSPTDIKWGDAPAALPPGAKFAVIEGNPSTAGALMAFRLKMPANYKIPPHFHPADEHVTVISGTFYMGHGDKVDEKSAKALPAGSFVVMPAREHHFAFTTGETIVQVHAVGPWGISYVNPTDDPRKRMPR